MNVGGPVTKNPSLMSSYWTKKAKKSDVGETKGDSGSKYARVANSGIPYHW